MKKPLLQAALTTATRSTFEELGLLLVAGDPAAAGVGDASGEPPTAGARVDFGGPWAGSVVLRVSDDVLDTAAANMMGRDAPPAEPLRRDALGEMTNVLCGNLLPLVAGRRSVFRLQAPRWLGVAGGEPPDGAPVTVALDVETGRASATLYLPAELLAGE